ncbi:peptide chain release factor-like protein [Vibrio azureus]|uniref:Peptide chain release factor homolog n=1 Tax=Vibrio azureus NBRC 104587 TaxID=1219077 RepID=U3CGI2_9VIBR|nr:peptide chain release factor H [Vibrio azureus]AUI85584.1 peptide chain release factor-like protein [Vibrio azureus]GAD77388.1 peptide chain release factor homolog [Vibrio azureus NBRC 104587]
MILLQLSSGQGPLECCKAVGLALKCIEKQCQQQAIELTIVDTIPAEKKGCFKSLLLKLESSHEGRAKLLASSWQGAMLWVCQSHFRPKHKRKNWFFGGRMFELNEAKFGAGVTYQTCRASGAGGQHVNTTNSAIRAVHNETGMSVRVESERSQHANKRLAKALLFQKLDMLEQEKATSQDKARWQQHWELERGNPVRTFKGDKFVAADTF